MITQEIINKLATQYQTAEINIIREYFQHLFLSQLYRIEGGEKILFKGGTALRIIYGSPRFSEDLDFSIFNIAAHEQKQFIEDIFIKILDEIARIGIKVELGPQPGSTAEGYYGEAEFKLYDYSSIIVSINVSSRNGREVKGSVISIPNDFIATYNIFHLPQELLVEEKIFDALVNRKKARDFYDLYLIMRKGLITPEQKIKLNNIKDNIINWAGTIDFSSELAVFLPKSHHPIIREFKSNLVNELDRQLSGLQ